MGDGDLLEFYGAECDHCRMVAGFLDRLEAAGKALASRWQRCAAN